jgi:hypothetical protein
MTAMPMPQCSKDMAQLATTALRAIAVGRRARKRPNVWILAISNPTRRVRAHHRLIRATFITADAGIRHFATRIGLSSPTAEVSSVEVGRAAVERGSRRPPVIARRRIG